MIYQPREDSFLLELEIKKVAKGRKVLDMGAGSGIIGIAALKSGAYEVLFSDINQEAVKVLLKKGYNAINSDLFSKIKGRFDIIAFNPPYLPEDAREDNESALITTGGKEGDEITCKFLRQAKLHLKKNGKIFLLFSSLTPKRRIYKICEEQGFSREIIAKQKLSFEEIYVLLLKEKAFKHDR